MSETTMPRVSKCNRTNTCPELFDHDSRCPMFDTEFWSKVEVAKRGEPLPFAEFTAEPSPAPAMTDQLRAKIEALANEWDAEGLALPSSHPWHAHAEALRALLSSPEPADEGTRDELIRILYAAGDAPDHCHEMADAVIASNWLAEYVEAARETALAPIERFANLLIEQGDEHVTGCMGQADCAACVHHDLRAAIAAARADRGGK